jgi:hypothetical protein
MSYERATELTEACMFIAPRNGQPPWFISPLCISTGMLLIAAGLPLYKRRIPPNRFYGVRLPGTLRDADAWYEVNERAGRDIAAVGALFLACYIGVQLFATSWDPAIRTLVPVVVLIISLIAQTISLFVIMRRVSLRMAKRRR